MPLPGVIASGRTTPAATIAFGAVLGENHATGTGTTKAITTSAVVPTAGRIIVAVLWYGSPNLTSVSGGSLTWAVDKQQNGVADGSYKSAIASARAPSGLASGTVLTATLSGTYDACATQAYYITGAAAASVVDVTGGAASATNADTTATANLTTTNAADFIAQAMWAFTTSDITPATGMTEIYDVLHEANRKVFSAYRVVTSTGTYAIGGSWTGATGYSTAGVAYKAA